MCRIIRCLDDRDAGRGTDVNPAAIGADRNAADADRVEADTFRRMVLELDRRFPGLGRQIEESMAVAIDGEIFQDAYLAQLKPESEIVLIPKIGGG